jgi:FemAB-related protein (PEP-CTERM system-associated)
VTIPVQLLEDRAAPAWDAFVAAAQDGTFFHTAAWRHVIERAFRHRAQYAYVERDGAITGILPLVHVKSRLFGNMLTSTPFCVYGGPLAADPESAAALQGHMADLLQRTGARAVELRYREPVETDWLSRPPLYVTFRKQMHPDAEANLKEIPRKQRAMVRKGMQNGLRASAGFDVDPHYRIYAESVRNLGTPVFSRTYFGLLLEVFRHCSDTVTILDGDAPVASVLNFYFRDEVLPYYGGGTARARARAANDFMYWEVMRRACERGFRIFDFGRSKIGSGSYHFKKNWGFEPAPLNYRYLLAEGGRIPEQNPLNPKFRLLISAWKRLPLPVANLLGPPIVRGIG